MKKVLGKFLLLTGLILSPTLIAYAGGWKDYLGKNLLGISDEKVTIASVIGGIIDILLTLAGVVAVIYLIIGGYQYVTSAGNPEQAGQAKNTILYAVIGMIVIFSAFLIVNFVLKELKIPH